MAGLKSNREPRLRHVSLWIVAFCINLGLQVFRSSWNDTAIFSMFTLVLIFASRTKSNAAILQNLKFKYVVEAALVISLLLIVLPWHNLNFGILVAAILILVISLIWSREHSERIVRDKRIRRSELLWVILAAALALWEFGANILGIQFKSLYVFPTISVLVDPMLDSQGGKAIFVCMWMAMGLGLLRLVRQR
ncbi:MAG: hypothetical protein RL556_41 [Actinomycetota bacterium]